MCRAYCHAAGSPLPFDKQLFFNSFSHANEGLDDGWRLSQFSGMDLIWNLAGVTNLELLDGNCNRPCVELLIAQNSFGGFVFFILFLFTRYANGSLNWKLKSSLLLSDEKFRRVTGKLNRNGLSSIYLLMKFKSNILFLLLLSLFALFIFGYLCPIYSYLL